MAIPSVISSLVTVVYNMADTFFVGQTGDALQVAAVSLTNPIFILLMAFANMFGMGGSAIISVALGENNHQSVKKISSFISWASLVVGAAFAAVLLCFTAPILHLFGADASTFEFARGYTVYIAFGAPFVIWSAAASFVVRAEGASKEAMIGSMIGTIANIVLDPVFVSGLEQGAAGSAHRLGRKGIVKLHALRCQLVQIGRDVQRLTEAAAGVPALLVTEIKNDVISHGFFPFFTVSLLLPSSCRAGCRG